MSQNERTGLRTTERSLDIIETLRSINGGRLTELSDELDLPVSTVHNHLQTLVNRGYVTKQDDQYHVGLRFLEFGEYARRSRKGIDQVTSELNTLANNTGETVSLLAAENGRGIVLYTRQSADSIPLGIHTGKRIWLHSSALGQSLLAFRPPKAIESIIDRHGLPAATNKTVTDPVELRHRLKEIRDNGIAVETEERLTGVSSVATPVKDSNGRVLYSVGMTVPSSRLTDAALDEFSENLQKTANLIELKITHS